MQARPGGEPNRTVLHARVLQSLNRAFEPVDAASLGVFRVMFGLLMMWEVCRYFVRGWITEYYVRPSFHFTYLFFDWVKPWPGVGMYVHFAALGACALCVALGLFYREASILLFLGLSYV